MTNFNPEKLICIGEGLAAGFGPFTLHRWSQRFAFPSLIARQLDVAFSLPLFEPPGIGNAPGFESLPVILPGVSQATVFDSIPPVEYSNLSVPGMTLAASLDRRPGSPVVARGDMFQTICNLILGGRRLATNARLLSQAECAAERHPTGVMISLGFTEALDAAVNAGSHSTPSLPGDEEFGRHYQKLVSLLSPARLLLFTVPDPFDTPFFLTPAHAARVLRVEESWLCSRYELQTADFLRLPAVHEIGFQIFGRNFGSLPSDSRIPGASASAISHRIATWNSRIRKIAEAAGAIVCDLHSLIARFRVSGVQVGNRQLTADYLGGLYGLNGYYLGHTGHALVANEVLSLLGEPGIDPDEIRKGDPAAQATPANGRLWTPQELDAFLNNPPAKSEAGRKNSPKARQTVQTSGARLAPLTGNSHSPLPRKLVLPEGNVQELALNPAGSYFGDGIAASDCETEADGQFDAGGQTLFGGVALVDSHLHGTLKFEFKRLSEDRASFRLHFGPLKGENAILAAPVMFQMHFQETSIQPHPAPLDVSSGEVDLNTGEVSKLRVYAAFDALALRILVAANQNTGTPLTDPDKPLSFISLDEAESPLDYSSASARFDQRPDGKLDFTFYGARFVPLGAGARWPLNFAGPDGSHASISARGTVMRPHLRLSTKAVELPSLSRNPPVLPTNTIRELTFHTHNTAFGDGFDLRVPELGGPCTGRSHIMGRVAVQFGIPSGGTVPVAVRSLPPGGIFAEAYHSPIADAFPVRLGPGPRGFDQKLRYPRATFTMEKISLPDDPFDIALGAVDLETGCTFSDFLHRAFIEQDVINALMRIESRVRHTSFFFRGPGVFETSSSNSLIYRFWGDEILPYPAGLAYPQPDFTSSYFAQLGATLNPYLWIRAMEDVRPGAYTAEGNFKRIVAANRDEFSCEYRIPADSSRKDFHFRYENHTQAGVFTLHTLTWVGFGKSAIVNGSQSGFDTITFSGFGIWEKNGVKSLEQVAAQIWKNSASALSPYIGIQVSSGDVSNVDLRPINPDDAHP